MIRRDRAAVPNAIQPSQRCLDYLAARPRLSVSDEADSARIVLESLVVKADASQSGSANISRWGASFHGKAH